MSAELKQQQTSALTATTKSRTSLIKLMSNKENLNLVKSELNVYDTHFTEYQDAHEKLLNALSTEGKDEDVGHKEMTRYFDHERNILDFKKRVSQWIDEAEDKLTQDLPPSASITGNSSHSSQVSVRSARAKEKAKIAALLVQKERQDHLHRVQKKRMALDEEEAKAKLDLELEKAHAKEQVYAAEIDDDKKADSEKTVMRKNKEQHTMSAQNQYQHAISNDSSLQTSNLAQLMATMTLPQPEVPKFGGNPLDFHNFVMAFESRITPRTTSDVDRLYYLDQHLEGEPKELISGCLHRDPAEGYAEAKWLLYHEYGNPFKVSTAYVNKVLSWGDLKANDDQELRKFAMFMNKCCNAMKNVSGMEVLNHLTNLQAIAGKLPVHLQHKWRDAVHKIREAGRIVCFQDIARFIERASETANDPVFSRSAITKVNDSKDKTLGNKSASTKQKTGIYTAKQKSSSFAIDLKSDNLCLFCNKKHDIDDCKGFAQKSDDEKRLFIKQRKLCFSCFGSNHLSKGCVTKRTCKTCNKKHPTCLHIQNFEYKKPEESSELSEESVSSSSCKLSSKASNTVLHAIVPVLVERKSGLQKVVTYAFLDNGSSGCFISQDLAKDLQAEGHETSLLMRTMHGEKGQMSTVIEGLVISTLDGGNPVTLPKCYTINSIPVDHANIPKPNMFSKWTSFTDAVKEMPDYLPDVSIGLLIGSNCPKAHQPLKVIAPEGGPIGIRYPHGWTICGPAQIKHLEDGQVMVSCNRISIKEPTITESISPQHLVRMFDQDFNDLYIDTPPGKLGPSEEDLAFLDIVGSNVQMKDGHYYLPLPFRDADMMMPNNRTQAEERLAWQKRKLLRNMKYHDDYKAFMNSLFENGYAEEVPIDEQAKEGKQWYLPHHGVYHPTKGKLRVVFDCSAKYNGASLNDNLLQGPDLTNSLVGVLCRFRQEPIAFMGDIEAMFHRVHVAEPHKNFFKFLWWPDGDFNQEPKEYRMVVHLFGATSSPSVANFALRKTAENTGYGEQVSKTIQRNFYVDDCLKSVHNEEEAVSLVHDLRSACAEGGFNLTKFCSNSPKVLSSIPKDAQSKELQLSLDYDDLPGERALGLYWNVMDDKLGFATKIKDKPATRRGILSVSSSVYDPLGMVAPFVLQAKRILQDLCLVENLSWDDIVPEKQHELWKQWLSELPLLASLDMDRCIKPRSFTNVSKYQLHIFSDACSTGYGAVAYVRMLDEQDGIHCAFLIGKARLAPIKTTTIPRLELTAATVAIRIGCMLKEEMDLQFESITYHTDSTTVLFYLANERKRFPIFEANRIQFIKNHSSLEQWKYINSELNPADIASRGMNIHQLKGNGLWFNGPDFLWHHKGWPSQPLIKSESQGEDVTIANTATQINESSGKPAFEKLLHHYSKWKKLQRAVAVFVKLKEILKDNVNGTSNQRKDYRIGVTDLQTAETAIVKYTQLQYFPTEVATLKEADANGTRGRVLNSSSIRRLDPFYDQGVIRVGGRLSKAEISSKEKHPVLLPHSSHITALIIQDTHEKLAHCGRNHVLAQLRLNYWIIHGNSAVRQVLSRCVTCKKIQAPVLQQKMADLPLERTRSDPPFTYTGVDFFGPFSIKHKRSTVKRYSVVFTCLASRAIHLEVAASLDTDSFLHALRRFIARRGPVTQIRCDNGTNFVSANRELQECLEEMDQGHLKDELTRRSIEFIFNPPTASHFGGIWERQIRSVRKVFGGLCAEFGERLDDESFQTLMCEVEAIAYSRPLTSVSSDPTDANPLTPNHILTMKSCITLPPPGKFQREDVYMRRRWRHVQYLANIFWNRWRKEYLFTLQERQKWNDTTKNLEEGNIVLIKERSLPRNEWAMGRVIKTEADSKGYVRSAILKTAQSNGLRRPISSLILLVES